MHASRVVILSGPSGVGKDTVLDAWQAADPRVERVITYTTRAPRDGEIDGVDYHFASRETFQRMAAAGEFLEHKRVHDHDYGTPRSGLAAVLGRGHIPVLKIDVQGAATVVRELPTALTVFLLPPSWEELERRIRARGLDDEAEIELRLANAKGELAAAGSYQYRIENDSVANVVNRLKAIVDC